MVNRFRGNSNHWKHNIQQYPIVFINMHLIVPETITLTVIIRECSFSLNIKQTGKTIYVLVLFLFYRNSIHVLKYVLILRYYTCVLPSSCLEKSNTNHYAYWTVSIASYKCLKLEIWQSITVYLLQQHKPSPKCTWYYKQASQYTHVKSRHQDKTRKSKSDVNVKKNVRLRMPKTHVKC